MTRSIIVILAAMLVASCTYHARPTQVRPVVVRPTVIEVHPPSVNHGPTHCPPGQRRNGRC